MHTVMQKKKIMSSNISTYSTTFSTINMTVHAREFMYKFNQVNDPLSFLFQSLFQE